jgi:ubiquinone/menaquinone biosynthesis C-methylase UbiE
VKRILAIALCGAGLAAAQVAGGANERYRTPEQRKGLVAGLAREGRNAVQRPKELVAAMNVRPGSVVADVGTGPGYLLAYLSEAVGGAGQVIAEDIFDDFLEAARERAKSKGLGNVSFVKGTETDPRLPAGGVDTVLLLDVYHHLDYPDKMMAAVRKALRPGGRLIIVEYYKRAGAIPGSDAVHHVRLDKDAVVSELAANGFALLSEREHIKGSQYMLVLESR